MATYAIKGTTLTVTVDLAAGFTESQSGKTMPAIDAAGMGRKVQWGTYKNRPIAGSIQVYIPKGDTGDREVTVL